MALGIIESCARGPRNLQFAVYAIALAHVGVTRERATRSVAVVPARRVRAGRVVPVEAIQAVGALPVVVALPLAPPTSPSRVRPIAITLI